MAEPSGCGGVVGLTLLLVPAACVPSCSNLKLESRVQRQSGSWVALASSFMRWCFLTTQLWQRDMWGLGLWAAAKVRAAVSDSTVRTSGLPFHLLCRLSWAPGIDMSS